MLIGRFITLLNCSTECILIHKKCAKYYIITPLGMVKILLIHCDRKKNNPNKQENKQHTYFTNVLSAIKLELRILPGTKEKKKLKQLQTSHQIYVI